MDQPGLFDPDAQAGQAKTDPTLPSPVELVPAPAAAPGGARKAGRMPKRVVLIDGHALAYRSYFAIQALTTKSGRPVQAIFGFLRTLLKLLRDGGSRRKLSTDHAIIVVFDAPAKTFRHEEYDAYKAGRAPTPDDLPQQIREIKHLVDLLGLSRLELAGFEADDIIGTLARRAEGENIDVRILSPDRDAFQLLSEKVKVLTSDYEEFGPAEVERKYGVSVAQWVDYRSLTGDSSDNIPGAKGIGPKTAQKLLQDYGALEFILSHLDEVKPEKAAEKIRESYQAVLDSQRLSRIVTDVPVDLDFRAALVREPDEPALVRELRDLEFSSFIRELGLENKREVTANDWTTPPEGAVFGFTLSEDSAALASLSGLAFATGDGTVHQQPVPDPEALRGVTVVNGADAKALAVFGQTHGLEHLQPGDDPMLMAYVLDSNVSDPTGVAQRYLEEDWPREPAGRAAAAQSLLGKLRPMLTGKLLSVYEDIERPTSRVLAAMETRGVSLDVPYLRDLSERLSGQMAELELAVWDLAGERFNLNSRDRLEAILYDKLQLESGKKTKLTGKRSTAVSALEPLRDAHPIVAKLLDYRELSKLKGTYLDPLPNLINPATGR
ncbi:MAG TPA: DNA polymerase, partial [Deinococcales bacterium]|nr:DNA polymerase [Deinococcales bacterium]